MLKCNHHKNVSTTERKILMYKDYTMKQLVLPMDLEI